MEDPANSWIYYNKLQDESKDRQYLFSLYWALATLTTIGYGDIAAHSDSNISYCIFVAERTASVIWMLGGTSFYLLLIGTMSTFLAAIDSKGHELSEKQLVISEFCKQAHIDPHLKERMKTEIEYRMNNNFYSIYKENSLLEGASLSLRYRVKIDPYLLASNEH